MSDLDFAITGLGRCRTAWFAAFLSDGHTACAHEFAPHCETPADFARAIVPGKVSGVADTMIWLCDPIPAKRVLVIHRDHRAAEAFQQRVFGVKQDLSGMAERLRAVPGLHVEFDEIDLRIREIVHFLTGREMDEDRFNLFAPLKIEVLNPMTFVGVDLSEYWRDRSCLQC